MTEEKLDAILEKSLSHMHKKPEFKNVSINCSRTHEIENMFEARRKQSGLRSLHGRF
jgi:hypothetical protein